MWGKCQLASLNADWLSLLKRWKQPCSCQMDRYKPINRINSSEWRASQITVKVPVLVFPHSATMMVNSWIKGIKTQVSSLVWRPGIKIKNSTLSYISINLLYRTVSTRPPRHIMCMFTSYLQYWFNVSISTMTPFQKLICCFSQHCNCVTTLSQRLAGPRVTWSTAIPIIMYPGVKNWRCDGQKPVKKITTYQLCLSCTYLGP